MSEHLPECAFCDIDTLRDEERLIRIGKHCLSFVSRPWFWPGHALVAPIAHRTKLSELTPDEQIGMLDEAGRIADIVDLGHGSQVFQKLQPDQQGNGITMAHVHMHVYPRLPGDERPIPTPEPNTFTSMRFPPMEETAAWADRLR